MGWKSWLSSGNTFNHYAIELVTAHAENEQNGRWVQWSKAQCMKNTRLLTLLDNRVPFVAVDITEAIDLPIGIMALVAEAEAGAEARSTRTWEALTVAVEHGLS